MMEASERTLKTRAGHKMFISTSTQGAHSTAMMIHRDWAQHVRETRHRHRWTRPDPAQSKVDIQLISIKLPLEVNHTTDDIDVVMNDIVEHTKGKRTITMWGGDFSATLQELSPDTTARSAGDGEEEGQARTCPTAMSSEIIKEHARGKNMRFVNSYKKWWKEADHDDGRRRDTQTTTDNVGGDRGKDRHDQSPSTQQRRTTNNTDDDTTQQQDAARNDNKRRTPEPRRPNTTRPTTTSKPAAARRKLGEPHGGEAHSYSGGHQPGRGSRRTMLRGKARPPISPRRTTDQALKIRTTTQEDRATTATTTARNDGRHYPHNPNSADNTTTTTTRRTTTQQRSTHEASAARS